MTRIAVVLALALLALVAAPAGAQEAERTPDGVQVEARHAALIRLRRDEPAAPRAFDEASERQEVLSAVQPFLRD